MKWSGSRIPSGNEVLRAVAASKYAPPRRVRLYDIMWALLIAALFIAVWYVWFGKGV